jgi:hypothetical protein
MAGIATVSVGFLLALNIFNSSSSNFRWIGPSICAELLIWPLLVVFESNIAYSCMGSYGGSCYRPQRYFQWQIITIAPLAVTWQDRPTRPAFGFRSIAGTWLGLTGAAER